MLTNYTLTQIPQYSPLGVLTGFDALLLCSSCPKIINATAFDSISESLAQPRVIAGNENIPQSAAQSGLLIHSISTEFTLDLRERLVSGWSTFVHIELLLEDRSVIRFTHKLKTPAEILTSLQLVGADKQFDPPRETNAPNNGGLVGIASLQSIFIDRIIETLSPVGLNITNVSFPNHNAVEAIVAGGENWIINGELRATLEIGDTKQEPTLPNKMVQTVFRRKICEDTPSFLQIWNSYCQSCHKLNFTSRENMASRVLAGSMPPAGTAQNVAFYANDADHNYLKSYLTSDCSPEAVQKLTFEAPSELIKQINEQLNGEARSVTLTLKIADNNHVTTTLIAVDVPEAKEPTATPTPTPTPTPDPDATPTPTPEPVPDATPTPTPTPTPVPVGPVDLGALGMVDQGSTASSSKQITVSSKEITEDAVKFTITGMTSDDPGLLTGLFGISHQVLVPESSAESATSSPTIALAAAACNKTEAVTILEATCQGCHSGINGDPPVPAWDRIHQRVWVAKTMPPASVSFEDARRFALGTIADKMGVNQDCTGSEKDIMTVLVPEWIRQSIADNLRLKDQTLAIKLTFGDGSTQTFNWFIAKDETAEPTPTPDPQATPTPAPTPAPLPELKPRAQLDLSQLKTIRFDFKTMDGNGIPRDDLDAVPELGSVDCMVGGEVIRVAAIDETGKTNTELRRTSFSVDTLANLTGKADVCELTIQKWRLINFSSPTFSETTLSGFGETVVIAAKATLLDPSSPLARNSVSVEGVSEVTIMRGIWTPKGDPDDLPIRLGLFITDMFGEVYGGGTLPRILPKTIQLHCASGQIGSEKSLLIPDAIHGLKNGYWMYFDSGIESEIQGCQFRFTEYFSIFNGTSGRISGEFGSGSFITSPDNDVLFVTRQIGNVRSGGNYVTKTAKIATGVVWSKLDMDLKQTQSTAFTTAEGLLFDFSALRSVRSRGGEDFAMLGIDACYGCGAASNLLNKLNLQLAYDTIALDRDSLLTSITNLPVSTRKLILADSLRGDRKFDPVRPIFNDNCGSCHVFPRSFIETEEMLRRHGIEKMTPTSDDHNGLALTPSTIDWIRLWSEANLTANNQYVDDTFLIKLTEQEKSAMVTAMNARRQSVDPRDPAIFELAIKASKEADSGWQLFRFQGQMVNAVLSDANSGTGTNPTPTPDPNATPTPTPDPNATPTPTPDPNATPTPDPNATPTPNPDAIKAQEAEAIVISQYMPLEIPTYKANPTGKSAAEIEADLDNMDFKGKIGPAITWPVANIPLELREPLCSHLSALPCKACDETTIDRCVRDLVYYTNAQRSNLTVDDFFGVGANQGLVGEFTSSSEIARRIVENVACYRERQLKVSKIYSSQGIPTDRAEVLATEPKVDYRYMAPFFADDVDNNFTHINHLIGCHNYQGNTTDYLSHTIGSLLGNPGAQPGCLETYQDTSSGTWPYQWKTRVKASIPSFQFNDTDLDTYLRQQVKSTCQSQLEGLASVGNQLNQIQQGDLTELQYIRNYASQCSDRFQKGQKTFNQEEGFIAVKSLAGKDQRSTTLFSIKDSRVGVDSQTRWLLYCPEAAENEIGVTYHGGNDLGDLKALKTSHVKMREATLNISQGTFSYSKLEFHKSKLNFNSFTVLQTGEFILDNSEVLVEKTALINARKLILKGGSKMVIRSPLKANTAIELHEGSFLEINAGAEIDSLLVRSGSVVAVAPFSGTWDSVKNSWTLTSGDPSHGSGRLQITANYIELDELSRITADGAGFCGNSTNGFDNEGMTFDGKGAGRSIASEPLQRISAYGTSIEGGVARYGALDFATKLYLGAGFTNTNCGGGAIKLKASILKLGGIISANSMLKNADKSCWADNVAGTICRPSEGTGGTIVLDADELYLHSGSDLQFVRTKPQTGINSAIYGQGRLAVTARNKFVSLGKMTRVPDDPGILNSLLSNATTNLVKMHISGIIDNPSYLETEQNRFNFGAISMGKHTDFNLEAALTEASIDRIPLLTFGAGGSEIDFALEAGKIVVQPDSVVHLTSGVAVTDVEVQVGGRLILSADFTKKPYLVVNGTLEVRAPLNLKSLVIAPADLGGTVTALAFPRDLSLWDGSRYRDEADIFGKIRLQVEDRIEIHQTGSISATAKGFPNDKPGWSYKGPKVNTGSAPTQKCPPSYGTFGRVDSTLVGSLANCSFAVSDLWQESKDLRDSLTLGTGGSDLVGYSTPALDDNLRGGGAIHLKTNLLINKGKIEANGGDLTRNTTSMPGMVSGTGGTVVIEATTAELGSVSARGGMVTTTGTTAEHRYLSGHGRVQLYISNYTTNEIGSYGTVVPFPQGGFASEIQNQASILEFSADAWGRGIIVAPDATLESAYWPTRPEEYESLEWPFGRVYQIDQMTLRNGAVAPFQNKNFGARINKLNVENTKVLIPTSRGVEQFDCYSGSVELIQGGVVPALNVLGPCKIEVYGNSALGAIFIDHQDAIVSINGILDTPPFLYAMKGTTTVGPASTFKAIKLGGDNDDQVATLTGVAFNRNAGAEPSPGNGVLLVNVIESLEVGRFGIVSMDGKGYQGGVYEAQQYTYVCTQGDSPAGLGAISTSPNGNAGGCQGSASHITKGKSAFPDRDGARYIQSGKWVMGAGGGGTNRHAGQRANGGGVIDLKASKIVLEGKLSAQGSSFGTQDMGYGAGGTINLDTKTLDIMDSAQIRVDTPIRYLNNNEIYGGMGRLNFCSGAELANLSIAPGAVVIPSPMEFNRCLEHIGNDWQVLSVNSEGNFRTVQYQSTSNQQFESHTILTESDTSLSGLVQAYETLGLEVNTLEISGSQPWSMGTTSKIVLDKLIIRSNFKIASGESLKVRELQLEGANAILTVDGALEILESLVTTGSSKINLNAPVVGQPNFSIGGGSALHLATSLQVKEFTNAGTITVRAFDGTSVYQDEVWSNPPAPGLGIVRIEATKFHQSGIIDVRDAGILATQTGSIPQPLSLIGVEYPSSSFRILIGGGNGKRGSGSVHIVAGEITLTDESQILATSTDNAGGMVALQATGPVLSNGKVDAGSSGAIFITGAPVKGIGSMLSPVHARLPSKTFVADGDCRDLSVVNNQLVVTSNAADQMSFGMYNSEMLDSILDYCSKFTNLSFNAATVTIPTPLQASDIYVKNGSRVDLSQVNGVKNITVHGVVDYDTRTHQVARLRIKKLGVVTEPQKIELINGDLYLEEISGGAFSLVDIVTGYSNNPSKFYLGNGPLKATLAKVDRASEINYFSGQFTYSVINGQWTAAGVAPSGESPLQVDELEVRSQGSFKTMCLGGQTAGLPLWIKAKMVKLGGTIQNAACAGSVSRILLDSDTDVKRDSSNYAGAVNAGTGGEIYFLRPVALTGNGITYTPAPELMPTNQQRVLRASLTANTATVANSYIANFTINEAFPDSKTLYQINAAYEQVGDALQVFNGATSGTSRALNFTIESSATRLALARSGNEPGSIPEDIVWQTPILDYNAETSCTRVKTLRGATSDGIYRFDPDGRGPLGEVNIYCHNMAGTPKAYLPLPNNPDTGSAESNLGVHQSGDRCTTCENIRFYYTQVAFSDLGKLELDTSDTLFVRTLGNLACHQANSFNCKGHEPHRHHFGLASGSNRYESGTFQIDLTNTGFQLYPFTAFSQTGSPYYMDQPSGAEVSSDFLKVTVKGGGYYFPYTGAVGNRIRLQPANE